MKKVIPLLLLNGLFSGSWAQDASGQAEYSFLLVNVSENRTNTKIIQETTVKIFSEDGTTIEITKKDTLPFLFKVKKQGNYIVVCSSKNYLNSIKKIPTIFTDTVIEFQMAGIIICLDMPILLFKHNTVQLTENGKEEFEYLLHLLNENPGLQIELRGCSSLMEKEKLALSRAKLIKDMLAREGIQRSRLSVKNFGNTNPVINPGEFSTLKDEVGKESALANDCRVLSVITGDKGTKSSRKPRDFWNKGSNTTFGKK